MIVALTVPLAVNLRERARAEVETQALIEAQTVAAGLDRNVLARPRQRLEQVALRYAREVEGRVLIMDRAGIVLADGNILAEPAASAVGQEYDTDQRPEIQVALDPSAPRPVAQIRFSDELGSDIVVAAAPILEDQQLVGAVRVTSDVQDVTDSVRAVTIGLVVVGGAGLVAGLLIAFGVAGSLARPLTRLARVAGRLGAGDLSARTGDVRGPTEVADLARSFDDMADRLERTVRAQREFVANASHQLRTPLTGMKLRLETAAAEATSDDARRQLEAAEREVDRLSDIVNRLLETARHAERGEGPSKIELRDAAERAAERWRERAERAGAAISASGDEVVAETNVTDLDQILDNLLENAIVHAPGPVEIQTSREDTVALVSVRDHGPGIPEDERSQVVERFYRGRGARSGGSGLGLAIARELVERCGGGLVVRGAEGGGTLVEVRLPPARAMHRG